MPGESTTPNPISQDALKILLDAGENFHREAEPGRIADMVVSTILRSVNADAAAIITVDPRNARVSIYKQAGKLCFDPASMDVDRLLCIMEFSPRIVFPVGDASNLPGALSVCAMVYPVQRKADEYIFWAERIAKQAPFQPCDLDLFTILVRQGMLAIENARLTQRLKHVESDLRSAMPVEKARNKGTDGPYKFSQSGKNIREEMPAVYSNRGGKHIVPLGRETWFDPERRLIATERNFVNLTPAESTLIAVLYHNNQQVLTHEDLVCLIQGYITEKEDAARILRPLVCRLRKKIEQVTDNPDWIQNIRGTGYRIDMQCFK